MQIPFTTKYKDSGMNLTIRYFAAPNPKISWFSFLLFLFFLIQNFAFFQRESNCTHYEKSGHMEEMEPIPSLSSTPHITQMYPNEMEGKSKV